MPKKKKKEDEGPRLFKVSGVRMGIAAGLEDGSIDPDDITEEEILQMEKNVREKRDAREAAEKDEAEGV